MQTRGGKWIDGETGRTDDLTPNCRVKIQNLPAGLDVSTAKIEYSTDGGNTWTYWGDKYTDEFDSRSIASDWTAQPLNATSGSATESSGTLRITGRGTMWRVGDGDGTSGTDSCYVVAKRIARSDWEVVTKVVSQTNSSPSAKAGIFVRNRLATRPSNAAAVLAVTPGEGIVFEYSATGSDAKPRGHICARLPGSGVKYRFPVYLKLVKVRQTYTPYYSQDAEHWIKMGTYSAVMSEEAFIDDMKRLYVGLYANSGTTDSDSTAAFDFFRVNLPATCTGRENTKGIQTITASHVPFGHAGSLNRIRFCIRDSYKSWELGPGAELVSPAYTVGIR